jgi:ribosome-binding factor A
MAVIGERRRARLGTLLREEIADVIEHQLGDPRIGMVTVTSVKVSADLSSARVYVTVVGDPEIVQTTMDALARAASYVRTEVARRIRIRQMPLLKFYEDDSRQTGTRVDELLREWRDEVGNGTAR